MAGEARRFWPPPEQIVFNVEMIGGVVMPVRALGMAVEGDNLLFFTRWTEHGGAPLSSRIPRERVLSVTTDASLVQPRRHGPA